MTEIFLATVIVNGGGMMFSGIELHLLKNLKYFVKQMNACCKF